MCILQDALVVAENTQTMKTGCPLAPLVFVYAVEQKESTTKSAGRPRAGGT